MISERTIGTGHTQLSKKTSKALEKCSLGSVAAAAPFVGRLWCTLPNLSALKLKHSTSSTERLIYPGSMRCPSSNLGLNLKLRESFEYQNDRQEKDGWDQNFNWNSNRDSNLFWYNLIMLCKDIK